MAQFNGLDTSGAPKILDRLTKYQKDLESLATDSRSQFYYLTSKSVDARDYFAKSQAEKNFTSRTDEVYQKLGTANARLRQYVEQFNVVVQNYKQFADSSANNVAANMRS